MYKSTKQCQHSIEGLAYPLILQLGIEVVVVDNVAGSDLLYCNSDPH